MARDRCASASRPGHYMHHFTARKAAVAFLIYPAMPNLLELFRQDTILDLDSNDAERMPLSAFI